MTLPWTAKYKPENSREVPQPAGMLQLKKYLMNFKSQNKKALLLHGPSGSCKTSAVHAVAHENALEIIEVNASDFRNEEQINERIGNALKQHSLFYNGKIILVDEIDGLAGSEDRGGIAALAALLLKEANFPIILTANDPWDSKLSSLRSKSTLVKFSSLNYLSIFNILKNICYKEGVACDLNVLKELARRSQGDLRAAINDLQALASVDNRVSSAEGLYDRNREESVLYAVSKVLKTNDINESIKAFDGVEENIDKCILWLDENLPKVYSDANDLAKAYEKLAKANIFMSRIRRWQHWRFLSYANTLITAGISSAKEKTYHGFARISPPVRLLKLWQAKSKYQKRKSIAKKLAKETHCSAKKALQSLAYLRGLIASDERMAKELRLENEEVEWLKEVNS